MFSAPFIFNASLPQLIDRILKMLFLKLEVVLFSAPLKSEIGNVVPEFNTILFVHKLDLLKTGLKAEV